MEEGEQPSQKQSGGEEDSGVLDYDVTELIVKGYGERISVPLDQEVFRIGRAEDNDLILQDPDVSKEHCEIRKQEGRRLLVDRDSKFGTYVNGNRVRSHVIQPGDRIAIGDAMLKPIFGADDDSFLVEDDVEPLYPEDAEEMINQSSSGDEKSESGEDSTSGQANSGDRPRHRIFRLATKGSRSLYSLVSRFWNAPRSWGIAAKIILGISVAVITVLVTAVCLSADVNLLGFGRIPHWPSFNPDRPYRGLFDLVYNWWAWTLMIILISEYEYWLWR